jgi:hypothetical protein
MGLVGGLFRSVMKCRKGGKGGKVGRPKGRKEYYSKKGYKDRQARGPGRTWGKDVPTTKSGSYRDNISRLISNQKRNAFDQRDWNKLSRIKAIQRDFRNSRGRFSKKRFPKDSGTEKDLRSLEQLGDWIRGQGE